MRSTTVSRLLELALNKIPLLDLRMRHSQPRVGDCFRSIMENIQINRPRSPALHALAAELRLNRLKPVEQVQRCERRLDGRDAVEIIRLNRSDGFGFFQRG